MEALLDPSAVSAIFGIPKSTVYKLTREKVLPGIFVGRHLRFHPDAIRAFLEAGGVRTGQKDAPGSPAPASRPARRAPGRPRKAAAAEQNQLGA